MLDTARNLFVERGFHRTGMAQIASASGIAVGQIYRDFENKEAIVAAICENDLATWLEEDKLAAAVATRDITAIRAWIERIGTDEPSYDNRRLLCEVLAEVGRNPIIAELHQRAEIKMRANLSAALTALAPHASRLRRDTLMGFILTLSWGITASLEFSPDWPHENTRRYASQLLQREIAELAA